MAQSIADIMANLDPRYRQRQQGLQLKAQIEHEKLNLKSQIENRKMRLQSDIAQAKNELDERHHKDLMQLHRDKAIQQQQQAEISATTSIEVAKINGENSFSLGRQSHTQALIQQDNQQVNLLEMQIREQHREQTNKVVDGHNNLVIARAEIIKQKLASEQQHRQELEKMQFASTLAMQEKEQEFLHRDYFDNQEHRREIEKLYTNNAFELQNREQEFLYKENFQKLSHRQTQEQKVLDSNLKKLEMHLEFLQQNYQTTYEMLNDIAKELLERFLQLGNYYATDEDISEWVNEAVKSYHK